MFEILQIKGILNIGEITYIIAVNTCTVLAIVLPQDCESILIEILLVYSLKDKNNLVFTYLTLLAWLVDIRYATCK